MVDLIQLHQHLLDYPKMSLVASIRPPILSTCRRTPFRSFKKPRLTRLSSTSRSKDFYATTPIFYVNAGTTTPLYSLLLVRS